MLELTYHALNEAYKHAKTPSETNPVARFMHEKEIESERGGERERERSHQKRLVLEWDFG